MPNPSVCTTGRGWTYGVEHELADWDTRKGWDGFGRDPEPNIMNSNGIAGDPTLRDYPFGGEINTRPTSNSDGQAEQLLEFLARHPRCSTSHRVGLHVHVRIPGLKDSLPHLKHLQKYITDNVGVYQLIDPLPYRGQDRAERKWIQYLRRSHWTAIPMTRVEKQLREATDLKSFLALEVPADRNGTPLYHAQPRASVNLRQLLQTDTIEFRPFLQTLDPEEVLTCVDWCRDYLLSAFDKMSAEELFWSKYYDPPRVTRRFPALPPYIHWQQLRWEATSRSLNDRKTAADNRERILRGEFDDVPNDDYEHLTWEEKCSSLKSSTVS